MGSPGIACVGSVHVSWVENHLNDDDGRDTIFSQTYLRIYCVLS